MCRIANLGLVHEFRLSRTGVIAENSGSVLHQSEFGRVAGLNDCIESRMKNSAKLGKTGRNWAELNEIGRKIQQNRSKLGKTAQNWVKLGKTA